MQRFSRITLLTLTLGFSGQASALDGNILAQIGQLGSLFKEWSEKLQNFTQLKDQLFGTVNYGDLKDKLVSRMSDWGLDKLSNLTGVDIQKLLGDAKNWQAKLDELKSSILTSFKDKIMAMFDTNSFDQKNKLWEAGVLNTDNTQIKLDGLLKQQQEALNKAKNIQDIGDSVKTLEDSKKTVEAVAKSSQEATEKSGQFAADVNKIQSTREGVMMLVKAQAAAMANQAYNATAITTATSQMAREQQVTNNQLSDLVNDRIEQRTGEVLASMHRLRMAEAKAVALGKQTKETIEWAAAGFTAATEKPVDVKSTALF